MKSGDPSVTSSCEPLASLRVAAAYFCCWHTSCRQSPADVRAVVIASIDIDVAYYPLNGQIPCQSRRPVPTFLIGVGVRIGSSSEESSGILSSWRPMSRFSCTVASRSRVTRTNEIRRPLKCRTVFDERDGVSHRHQVSTGASQPVTTREAGEGKGHVALLEYLVPNTQQLRCLILRHIAKRHTFEVLVVTQLSQSTGGWVMETPPSHGRGTY